MDRLASDPHLHVYHYAPYEPTAVKRLAGRYGTREEEVDRLLRGGVFVDLYRAVRQGIRASVESYSIKRLEPLYDFEREVDLRDAGTSIVEFETWLELGQDDERDELLARIEEYNRDDCVSTLRLRDWLESQRQQLQDASGTDLPRPTIIAAEEQEDSEAQQAVNALVGALLDGLPESAEERTPPERGRWLLAQLLNWHRREAKSFWWAYFALMDLSDEERAESQDVLVGPKYLSAWPDPNPRANSTIYRFRFQPQEHGVKEKSTPHDPATRKAVGSVVHLDNNTGEIHIKRGNKYPAPLPASLVPFDLVYPKPKPQSLQRLAEHVLAHGIDGPGPFRAARDLLMRNHPRTRQPQQEPHEDAGAGRPLRSADEDAQTAAPRIVAALDESYLAIQGPPGSGKSSVGAEMIVDLVERGWRIGVTANSHKVIGALLEKAASVAARRGVEVKMGHRSDDPPFSGAMRMSNEDAGIALASGEANVVGGTSWLWAREEMMQSVDALFIDEAGQMSLADTIASALCARNLVLLGDPQQLDQPLQGVHPPGAERSALAHVLQDERVMPDAYGLFLGGSFRLHPDICAYTSEVFYEGRLRSHPGRERLALTGAPPLSGTGIRFLPVQHQGRTKRISGGGRADRRVRDRAARVQPFLRGRRSRDARVGWERHPHHHAVQRAGEGAERGAPRLPRRHRRQVSGAGGAHRHLLDGDEFTGRGAARNGVSLQPQPAERRDEQGAVSRGGGGES